MGRLIFVIEENVLLIFFTVPLIFFFIFLLATQELLKTKVSVEPCLVSVMVLMRGCSGMDEYEAEFFFNKKIITVYSQQKTRLHHCLIPIVS